MERRAEAVLSGDRAAFLATVDDRDVDVRAEQARFYDNLSLLPVTGLSYYVSESARTPLRIPGGDPVVRPFIVEHLSMTGFDDERRRRTRPAP